MDVVYTSDHALHACSLEFYRGAMTPCVDSPSRIERIRAALARADAEGELPVRFHSPESFDRNAILRVHDAHFVRFLETVFDSWRDQGAAGDALPHAWRAPRAKGGMPTSAYGRLGYYAIDAGTPICSGTWVAALAGVDATLTALGIVQAGARSAFALTRPPGHHAGRDYYGGYCFLNNAAIAAQAFLDQGARRVAILDIDYHHGNGSQDIFWERDDVLVASIHGDPETEYPYYSGHADECGAGSGVGYTKNLPLPLGTAWERYVESLADALQLIHDSQVERLTVSLGVDTFADDPISGFRLESEDFVEIGRLLAGAQLPTLFVMEGGYDLDSIGLNVANVLIGFQSQASTSRPST